MKKNLFALAALGVALIPALASAETAELRVIGTIVPGACAPVFTGGGTVDHGTIFASTLSATDQTVLPIKTLGLTVTCEAPTRISMTIADERAASKVPGLDTGAPGSSDETNFGLGTAAGRNIGAYNVQLTNATGDGGAARFIRSLDGGTTWAAIGGTLTPDGRMYSYAAPGAVVPLAFTTVTNDVTVYTAIDAADNLDLTNDVPLDGLATLEVTYL